MNSVHHSRQLMHAFADIGMRLSKPQRTNLAMLCAALAVSPNCHLSTLALALPVAGQRDNLVQRLRRLLKDGPSWQRAYRPLVRHLFAHWDGAEVALVMDRTDLGRRRSVLTLSVAHGHRALALTWQVRSFGGTGAEAHIALLEQVRPLLPAGGKVTFFGDAEFRAVPLQAYCRDQGWHWHVGLKSDLIFRTANGAAMALGQLPIRRGQRLFVQNVLLTDVHTFGPVNLIADWPAGQDWPRFFALDQPADRRAWRRGRKRFWIEPSFRDWKSYGFDLEGSHLDCPDRIDTLLLAMAITSLWMIHLGVWLTRTGGRHVLEAHHRRDYSLFRLGRDYLQRAQTMGWDVPVGFTVRHHPAHRVDLTSHDRQGMFGAGVTDRRFCTRSGVRSVTPVSASPGRQPSRTAAAA